MASDLLERQQLEQTTDTGDHDLFSHYVKKTDFDLIWLEGKPATALCGKVWLPTKDPKNFPVCPECAEIYQLMKPE
ncbi:DUF3039 domain-containing protein [Curtobacterium sp. MCBD17_040]|uniref:DUF3039 domain-containing protein n=1 Tax=Curtobacterium sp. MCBD17_040 TaxID=2175674 RepID=UPI000DAA89BC|nr:DUF3039 domain-containing protein [Curtobacterium sp. MCBD17_040]WIB65447.1 DUF3039 domain-containing protein [Curtobacterium sp. MCBD17_040]